MAAAKRRKTTARAARRRAKRTTENLLARERAQESAAAGEEAEQRPRVARHVDQLDHLLMRGLLSADQAKAGARFCRDYEHSGSTIGRLTSRYEPNMPKPPGKHRAPADTPGTIAARERFERAVRSLGPLAGVVIHVAICDLPPESWGVRPDAQNGDGIALLRFGLAALGEHYAGRWASTPSRAGASPRVPSNRELPAAVL